ncbi:MAG: RNA 2',3'-cyclic phosphodiesterase [Gammaproteobacteria bacterium]|nr:RNA 2',3'-cyclic phosphodiesterase [Gammaproteobacteria bacterium]
MNKTRRLFFALWPDEAMRHRLDEIAAEYRPEKSRAIPVSNLHATLIFLGGQLQESVSSIEDAASSVNGQVFTLSLQQLQVWRRPQVLSLCPEQVPEELTAVHNHLQGALLDIGVSMDERSYRPHVTLARKVRHPIDISQLPSPVEWPVNGFSLIESVSTDQGVQYHELENWSFDQ